MREAMPEAPSAHYYDVIVVGAGMGGLYALHRFREQGLSVVAFEGGDDVGGVWHHNRYPGARVDVQSTEYCYYFSEEIYREWQWTERYAAQPELFRYLSFVADRLMLRPLIRFNTRVTDARWDSEAKRWVVSSSDGGAMTSRFVIMATGNLSIPRKPPFEGLDDFKGEWVQTSQWPTHDVQIAGRRVAVVGTGSSGVQVIPVVAEKADHLFVMQRSANFVVPARNGPIDKALLEDIRQDVPAARKELFESIGGSTIMKIPGALADYNKAQQQEKLDEAWAIGGHVMNYVFADQEYDLETNKLVSDYVRSKIGEIVRDAEVAERLVPRSHPIGVKRLCVDTGYYETFNRENVTLVDIGTDPIRITETGIATGSGHYDVDLIIFAIGFEAFTGALNDVDIRNDRGEHPTERWAKGPRTLFGISTAHFPNFFFLCGAGGPSVLANFFLLNEQNIDWIADAIAYMDNHGYETIEPSEAGEAAWTDHVAEVSVGNIRLQGSNWMLHRNADGSRVLLPYIGGFGRYVAQMNAMAADGYPGFTFT